jgi:hypothetical protein
MDDDKVGVALPQFAKHVVAHNTQINVSQPHLAHHVTGALEPHLQVRDLGEGATDKQAGWQEGRTAEDGGQQQQEQDENHKQ